MDYNCQTYVGGVTFAAVRKVTLHKLLVKMFFHRLYVILLQFTTQLNLIGLQFLILLFTADYTYTTLTTD